MTEFSVSAWRKKHVKELEITLLLLLILCTNYFYQIQQQLVLLKLASMH